MPVYDTSNRSAPTKKWVFPASLASDSALNPL